jgi:hypothetical protein
MPKASVRWHNPLAKGIKVGDLSLRHAVWTKIQRGAIEGQNYMRTNATWTDRTGNARQGLFGRAYRKGVSGYVIVYYGTVPYQIWLEIANSGKYKIIQPTLQIMGPRVMADLRGIMGSMRAAG